MKILVFVISVAILCAIGAWAMRSHVWLSAAFAFCSVFAFGECIDVMDRISMSS
jgi:hypothetical protein